MADTLKDLNRSLNLLARRIQSKMAEQQSYLNKANEIQAVYDRMYSDKKTIKEYRKKVNHFYKNTYDEFKGNNFRYSYKPEVKNLLNTYDYVIGRIDTNLDALNNAILKYKNMAADCWGPLGSLRSSYNTIKTRIQNWTN